jgi:hypothetical protein
VNISGCWVMRDKSGCLCVPESFFVISLMDIHFFSSFRFLEFYASMVIGVFGQNHYGDGYAGFKCGSALTPKYI